ncbi:MarR family winged helix-turn-helix transcriptional regulator [Devosia sp.]|uniref:MarR family winged helix-turn-helix transcriptional regulator n=1 Tax=Devosia sp. TaxID=1871048 RepID=UPI003267C967
MSKETTDDAANTTVPGIAELYRAELHASGLSNRAADAAIEIEEGMAQLRRSMGRREVARLAIDKMELNLDPAHVDIMHILAAADGSEVTVGTVAARLDVDPSRASRLVGDMVDLGSLRRVASQRDSRRICLELTDVGRAQANKVRLFKWKMFADVFIGWDEDDLVDFARLFNLYLDQITELKLSLADQTTPPPAE